MKNQVNRLLQTALAVCCLVVASCQQAPPAQVEAEYEVMTIAPADRTLTSVYSATIRGRQDIEIYPQVSGFLTKRSEERRVGKECRSRWSPYH